jgi:predicted nucleotidyltransferase
VSELQRPRGEVEPAVLEEVVRRIVEVADPDRIILFGSAARGELTPDSDIDLLVIKSDVDSRSRLEETICRNLWGIPIGVDAIVFTPGDIERWVRSHPSCCCWGYSRQRASGAVVLAERVVAWAEGLIAVRQ